MYNYRTTRVRVEHEIRLVLRGDLTVSDASERIMILAKLWNGDIEDGDHKQDNSALPPVQRGGEGDKSD